MSINKLVVANPFLEEHLNLIKKYEEINNLESFLTNMLRNIREKYNEQKYKKETLISNELNLILFITKNNNVTNICNIQCARDIKTCTLFLAPTKEKIDKKFIPYVLDYVFTVLGMEEIFINIKKNDKEIITILNNENFENLGEENGNITFLKENLHEKDIYSMHKM